MKYSGVAYSLKRGAQASLKARAAPIASCQSVSCAAGRRWQSRQPERSQVTQPMPKAADTVLKSRLRAVRSTVLFPALLCLFTPAQASVHTGKMGLHIQSATSVEQSTAHLHIDVGHKQFIYFSSEKHETAALTSAWPRSASAPSISRASAWMLRLLLL